MHASIVPHVVRDETLPYHCLHPFPIYPTFQSTALTGHSSGESLHRLNFAQCLSDIDVCHAAESGSFFSETFCISAEHDENTTQSPRGTMFVLLSWIR